MRVLMTTDAVGGVWTYAIELAGALRERDVHVTLAVLGPPPSAEQLSAWPDVRVCAGKLEWQDEPWEDVERAGEWLLALEAELRPDVVHSNTYAHAALPFRAPVLVVGHSCVLSWWESVHGAPAPLAWNRYRSEVRRGLLAADSLVAPTAAMLGALQRIYELEPGRGTVVPNGVRDRFSPSTRCGVVLAAGRLWDAGKGLDVLENAAPSVAWPVEVAGDGGRAEHVQLLGRLDPAALRARMESAAIFAHPARYEPFGLAPLEAAMAGCALVLGDLPSLREVWGEAALFVRPGDAGALSEAINRLIGSPTLREDMAERAGRRAARYSAERMAAGHMREYTTLTARREAAAA